MNQRHEKRYKVALAWGMSVVVLGCSVLLASLALQAAQDQQRQARWERKEALTLQAKAIAGQVLHQLDVYTQKLWMLPRDASLPQLGEQLQRQRDATPWMWHMVVLSEGGDLLYPSMPWEDPSDALLLRAAQKVSCLAFQQMLRRSHAGQAARMSAAFVLLKRFPTCPLRRALRIPLLYDSHLRHAAVRSWLFVSSRTRTVWQLHSPDYVMILRMRNKQWIGLAIPLQTHLSISPHLSPFRSAWLSRLTRDNKPRPDTILVPLSGHLAGYRLSFQCTQLPDATGMIRFIVYLGTMLTWLACGVLLFYLHRQEQWSRQRSSLFAALAHELKTPVAAQLSLLGHLQRQATLQGRLPYQQALFKETKRLQQLIDNLLALNRVELPPTTRQRVDITALTLEVLESVEHTADEKQQELLCETRTPYWVHADPVGLELALRNLIDNAIKYTPEYGTIQIEVTKQDRWLCWWIRDNGPGIAPEWTGSLFSPFVRGESREQPGSGLGLYIAQSIIKQAGGRLDLDTTAPKGAHFRILLPALDERDIL